jgi:uncharacterized protein (DUF2062 family)
VGPTSGVTEDRVKVLVNLGFTEYERIIGNPRHLDNTRRLDELNDGWQQVKGAMFFGKIIAGFIAFLCMAILSLLLYLATNKQQSVVFHSNAAVTASAPQSAEMR